MMKRIIVYSLATILFASCQTKNVTEAERFDASVRKELPFAGTSLAKRLLGVDIQMTEALLYCLSLDNDVRQESPGRIVFCPHLFVFSREDWLI
jgi:hypothetical protein